MAQAPLINGPTDPRWRQPNEDDLEHSRPSWDEFQWFQEAIPRARRGTRSRLPQRRFTQLDYVPGEDGLTTRTCGSCEGWIVHHSSNNGEYCPVCWRRRNPLPMWALDGRFCYHVCQCGLWADEEDIDDPNDSDYDPGQDNSDEEHSYVGSVGSDPSRVDVLGIASATGPQQNGDPTYTPFRWLRTESNDAHNAAVERQPRGDEYSSFFNHENRGGGPEEAMSLYRPIYDNHLWALIQRGWTMEQLRERFGELNHVRFPQWRTFEQIWEIWDYPCRICNRPYSDDMIHSFEMIRLFAHARMLYRYYRTIGAHEDMDDEVDNAIAILTTPWAWFCNECQRPVVVQGATGVVHAEQTDPGLCRCRCRCQHRPRSRISQGSDSSHPSSSSSAEIIDQLRWRSTRRRLRNPLPRAYRRWLTRQRRMVRHVGRRRSSSNDGDSPGNTAPPPRIRRSVPPEQPIFSGPRSPTDGPGSPDYGPPSDNGASAGSISEHPSDHDDDFVPFPVGVEPQVQPSSPIWQFINLWNGDASLNRVQMQILREAVEAAGFGHELMIPRMGRVTRPQPW